MSLIRIALRMTAVMALKGRTLAGDNVLDSEIGILGEDDKGLYLKGKKRFIAVYTDEGKSSQDESRDILDPGQIALTIEYGVTDQMVIEEEDPDDPAQVIRSVIPGIPFTSRMPELYLDLLGRQIRTGLQSSDTEAADVFRSLFMRVVNQKMERADCERQGERVAAQKITLVLEPIGEPRFTSELADGLPFARYLALLDAGNRDDQLIANLIRSEIPAAPETDQMIQERLGATNAEMAVLGFGYADGADEDSTFSGVSIEATGSEPVEISN